MNPQHAAPWGRRLRLPLLGGAAFFLTLAMVADRSWHQSGQGTLIATATPAPVPNRQALAASATDLLQIQPAAVPEAVDVQQIIDEASARGESAAEMERRVAAIAALVHVPRKLALPVLERIVKQGESAVERQVALGVLHDMAMRQGDDGAIRDLLRELIYDGNDERVSESATATLASLDTPR